MRDAGGFEGNAQTLRILAKLEKMSASAGSNLTRRSLLSVMKYPAAFSDVVNIGLAPRLLPSTTTIRILDRERSKPPKCYHDSERDTAEWILDAVPANERAEFQRVKKRDGKHGQTQHKSLDCSIMDVADEIAYGVHDLEDAIALRLIRKEQFRSVVTPEASKAFLDWLAELREERRIRRVHRRAVRLRK